MIVVVMLKKNVRDVMETVEENVVIVTEKDQEIVQSALNLR
jgi:hypothetical protein